MGKANSGADLREMQEYCRRQLLKEHGPEEGERRFQKLSIVEALQMWNARGK
jgi:hypothetical protein